MAYPATRMRRLRATGALRGLIRETELTPAHFIYPMFVELGVESRTPIESMPGVDRVSINTAVEDAGEAFELGVPAVMIFGVPAVKDEFGSGAYDDEGVEAQAAPLVTRGRLDGFLTSRTGIVPRHRSNGHARSDYHQRPISRMGVLEIEAENGLDDAGLKQAAGSAGPPSP